jgi:dienelactone hydrolase
LINILHFKNLNKIFLIFLIFFSACSNNGDEIIEEEEKKISNLVPLGYSKFIFDSYAPLADKPIDVHTYLPDTTDTTIPVLFVIHGNARNAKDYCFAWVESAQKYNFLVICPELDALQFPTSEEFQLGGIFKNDQLVDSTKWAFNYIEEIFAYLKSEKVTSNDSYGIYGHSAGSQFTHRLALFTESKNASIFIAANAGWYTTVDFNESFPYGLKNAPIDEKQLIEKFKYPITILLGENDTDPNASSLRKTEEAMRQGIHRFARGNFFYNMAKDKADQFGVTFNWKLQTVPNVGHSNTEIASVAAQIFISSLNN